MKLQKNVGVVALGAVLFVSLAVSLGLAPQGVQPKPQADPATGAGANAFIVDAVHSSVMFKISHMGVSNCYGRFNDISGTYTMDDANPSNCKFDFQVKTDSIDTNSDGRDKHLKSPDFFNVTEFPTIAFKGNGASKTGDKLSVTGELTMHGATKPVAVEMEVFPAKETRQGFKGGFDAVFKVKRTDFGMDKYVTEGALGDEVTIMVAVEGAKAK